MPDVVIVGGGLMGCATAVYLLRHDPTLDVTIVERDPSYGLAATPRASGGIRQLFTCPENVRLSKYTIEVLDRWPEFSESDATAADLGWTSRGYLFVGEPEWTGALRQTAAAMRACDVGYEWMEPGELASSFPELRTDDLGPAVLSPRDGWLDPHAFLMGFRRLAAGLGATFVADRVRGFSVRGTRVRDVRLGSGTAMAAQAVVNTAGCWAAELAAGVGMDLPVEPMRRFEHFVESPADLAGYPFVKDPHGLAIRPEAAGAMVGLVDFSHPGGFDTTVDGRYFERRVWPALSHRVPGFDAARLRSTTAGLYDQNRLDGNMVIGNWPGRLDNFYLACGFSGHGMMHGPGVGRAMAELILFDKYLTIDLTAFGYQRILDGCPYGEVGVR